MELVENEAQIAMNVITFNSYAASNKTIEVNFFGDRLRQGNQFACLQQHGRTLFAPSRFVGYAQNTAQKHTAFGGKHGTRTTVRIDRILHAYTANEKLENRFQQTCTDYGLKPANRQRGYWLIPGNYNTLTTATQTSGEPGFPDEIAPNREYVEGGAKSVLVNRYERDPAARKACIEHYGWHCQICKFNFEAVYGEIGKDFIHVHHLKPETLRTSRYVVNPILDLIPVCPNCHSMLHTSDPPFEAYELRALINGNG